LKEILSKKRKIDEHETIGVIYAWVILILRVFFGNNMLNFEVYTPISCIMLSVCLF